ncbi:MAG: Ig-like domain-containing protein, partial [Pseudomonadota bacterium]|nr:Ig-like domain-containing protein [Pseudomonadota bacterium]
MVRLYLGGIIMLLAGCLGGGGGAAQEDEQTESPQQVETILLYSNDTLLPQAGLATVGILTLDSAGQRLPQAALDIAVSGYAQLIEKPLRTDQQGWAQVEITDEWAENVTLIVTSGSITQALPLFFGAQLTFVPSSTQATHEAELTALLKDGQGRPLENQTIDFSFINNNNKTLTPQSVSTDEQGIAEVTITDLAQEGGRVGVKAQSGQLATKAIVQFALDINTVELNAKTAVMPVGASTVITVRAIDNQGNPLTHAPLTAAVSANATLAEVPTTTDNQGRAEFTVTHDRAEPVEVTVTVDTYTQTIPLYFGAQLSLLPETVTATNSTTLTALLKDAQDMPLAEQVVSFHFQGRNQATLTPQVTLTQEDGTAEVEVTDLGQNSGEVIVVARSGQIEAQAQINFEDSTVSEVNTVTLTTVDHVHALPVGASITVNVSTLGGGSNNLETIAHVPLKATVSGSAQLEDLPETTDENGQATFRVTDQTAETVTVTVTAGSITQTLDLFFGAHLTLVPQTINAIAETTLTALLKDSLHQPIAEQTLHFQFTQTNQATLNPPTTVTEVDGSAQVTVTDVTQEGGRSIVKVRHGALAAQATVNFQAAFGTDRQLQVTTNHNVLNAGQQATITAQVTDSHNLPIENQRIEFSIQDAQGGQAQVSPTSGLTNAAGQLKATVSDNRRENISVLVRAGNATQEIPFYFGARLTLQPAKATSVADNATPVELTATVQDALGAGLAGLNVDFSVTSGQAILDHFRSVTDDSGQAVVNVTSDTPGQVAIKAQSGLIEAEQLSQIRFEAAEANELILRAEQDTLSLNSSTLIYIEVNDILGNPVSDGTRLDLTTDIGTITPTVFTQKGQASAHFNATTEAGLVTITATVADLSETLTLEVEPAQAGVIEIESIEPSVIGIQGSGITQSATLTFSVKDSLGNLVADNTPVHFKLDNTTLGGGEQIMTQGAAGLTATNETHNGLVNVTVFSGTVAGTIDVIATVDTISTVARVTIASSVPDADHFSIAVEHFNIAGGVTYGLQNPITAIVSDRFGNIVPDGTSVSFISEGGTIGKSIGGGVFTTTTEFGQATAVLQSASPTTPHLGGVSTLRTQGYQCSGDYAFEDTGRLENLCGNPGLVTIVAYTTGSESFVDVNGNGRFDTHIDRHSQLGFEDKNGNQQWDLGEVITQKGDVSEPFIDGNDNN